MDLIVWWPEVLAAIIGGFFIWLVTRAIPTMISNAAARSPVNNSIIGEWDSWWGPTPEEVKRYHEIISIKRYAQDKVRGIAKRDAEPDKEWELEGRFDGHYLQMYYYPSKRSRKPNYTDYGCYFFVPDGDTMVGLSSGKGPDEATGKDTVTTEHCLMRKR